jgi:NAD(P)H-flavin reductase
MADMRDDRRLKKQIADKDGVRNTVNDILTNRDADDLAMEDEHEKLSQKSNETRNKKSQKLPRKLKKQAKRVARALKP